MHGYLRRFDSKAFSPLWSFISSRVRLDLFCRVIVDIQFCSHKVIILCSQDCVLMSRINVLSDQGLRLDGRKPEELRKLSCRLGIFSQADGSAYLEQGNTKVLAAVYGPHEVMYIH